MLSPAITQEKKHMYTEASMSSTMTFPISLKLWMILNVIKYDVQYKYYIHASVHTWTCDCSYSIYVDLPALIWLREAKTRSIKAAGTVMVSRVSSNITSLRLIICKQQRLTNVYMLSNSKWQVRFGSLFN